MFKMQQEIGLAYCGGTEDYYDGNSMQSGSVIQFIFYFSSKNLVQGD